MNWLINILNKIIINLTKIVLKTKKFFSVIFLALNKTEKIIITVLLLIILLCSSVLVYKKTIANTQLVPASGGDYREGIIINSVSDVEPVINQLTKIGLVGFDQNGSIVPNAAISWEISDDQKTYTFKLQSFIKSSEVSEIIKKEKPDWSDLELTSPDDSTLTIKLKQPFSPLLANFTEPLFPYGPYRINKQSSKEIIFAAKPDFFLGKPNIDQIELKFYPNENNLNKALKSHQIDGVANSKNIEIPSNWNSYQMILPRYEVLFFNLKRDVVKDVNVRKKLASNTKLDNPIDLILVTNDSPEYVSHAQDLKDRWQALGANITIIIKTSKELQQTVIPSRDFDLLLYGLDYGRDPDPYPFWHSTQVTNTGLNLSGFSNVDADKLLEDARLTNNADDRAKKYQTFQNILNDQVPAIFLNQITWQYAVSKDVKGIIDHKSVSEAERFFEVWKWYIRTQRVRK